MLNQLKVIWYGLGGAFAGYHPVETRLWIYISGVLFNIGLLVMNSFISFSFDRDSVWRDSVGLGSSLSFSLALVSTILLAFVALHFISYLGFLASAKAHKRLELLVGVTRWSVFFTLVAVLAVSAIEIYRNYHGSEDIAQSNTLEHIEDPTATLDDKYSEQEENIRQDYKTQIARIQKEIDHIDQWTGKSHSCTKTNCPTRRKGKGTIGAHWKGVLTAFGVESLNQLKTKREKLVSDRKTEIANVRTRKQTVMAASVASFQQDVNRYQEELALKNTTFKGFVLIAFPAAFVIAFLLSNITYLAIEYLYDTGKLQRPVVTSRRNESAVYYTATDNRNAKPLTQALVDQRLTQRDCVNCGTDISYKRKDAKTCSDGCRIAYNEWKKGYSVAAVIQNRKRMG